MKLIRDLHAILVGLFHMIAGDIQEWRSRKRREHEQSEPETKPAGPVTTTVAGVLSVLERGLDTSPKPKPKTDFISAGVRVQRALEKRKRYDDYSMQELFKLEEDRRKQRDLQFVMSLIKSKP